MVGQLDDKLACKYTVHPENYKMLIHANKQGSKTNQCSQLFTVRHGCKTIKLN